MYTNIHSHHLAQSHRFTRRYHDDDHGEILSDRRQQQHWDPLTTIMSSEPHECKNKRRRRWRGRQPVIIVVVVFVPKTTDRAATLPPIGQATWFGCLTDRRQGCGTFWGRISPKWSGRPGSCDAAKQQTPRLHYGAIRRP